MSKNNPKVAAELEALIKYLEADPDVAAARPIDEVRAELRADGIETGAAERWLEETVKRLEIVSSNARAKSQHRRTVKMAASDGENCAAEESTKLFFLATITVDGDDRELMTDGRRVFVNLRSGERRSGIVLDAQVIPLETNADGSLALLLNYGRAKVRRFITLTQREPDKHTAKWTASVGEAES